MLLRKYIHELLSSYYKQPHSAVVGAVNPGLGTNPINFRWILGRWHWQIVHRYLYRKQTGQWLTPVELFRPFYSRIVGNFIAKEAGSCSIGPANQEKLEIIEIGETFIIVITF